MSRRRRVRACREDRIPPVSEIVGLEAIRDAHERVRPVVVRTPLHRADDFEEEVGGEVRLKLESLQRAGSFKIRGAYNFLAQTSEADRARGVVTYSSGNHAQAVALAASLHGIRAVVVMPVTASELKRAGAKRLGAEVVLEGTTSLHRKARAEAIAQAEGLTIVPPFDHPSIIAGQGTVGIEVAEDWDAFDTVLVPVGGGGLLSGVAAALRQLRPGVEIVGVEPEGAASMHTALDQGGPLTLKSCESIADGLIPVRVGDLTYLHVQELVDDIVLVDDEAIREAVAFLFARQRLVVEFSGAATVAALRSGLVSAAGRRTVAVVSGGNIDPSLLASF